MDGPGDQDSRRNEWKNKRSIEPVVCGLGWVSTNGRLLTTTWDMRRSSEGLNTFYQDRTGVVVVVVVGSVRMDGNTLKVDVWGEMRRSSELLDGGGRGYVTW